MPFQFIDNRTSRKQSQLTLKQLKEIDKRRLYAIKANNFEEIKEAKSKIIGIIDKDGLENDNQKVRLDTAIKTLDFVTPKLKSTETVILTKKIEDIIRESTQEAEFEEINEKKGNSGKTE